MGASLVYLEKPNKDINFDQGENEFLSYTAGEMQGWRINMVSKITNKHYKSLWDWEEDIFSAIDILEK